MTGMVAVAGASVPMISGSRSGELPGLKMITADAPAACALRAFWAKEQVPRWTRAMLPGRKPAKSAASQPLVEARGGTRLMSTAVTAAVTLSGDDVIESKLTTGRPFFDQVVRAAATYRMDLEPTLADRYQLNRVLDGAYEIEDDELVTDPIVDRQ